MNYFIHHEDTKSTKGILASRHTAPLDRTRSVSLASSRFKKDSI